MSDGSNTAGRIAELRKRIASNKGVADRAYHRAEAALRVQAVAERQIRRDQAEIEALGGKVRR